MPPPSDSEEGIAHVVLCGGGARMHCMGRLLKELTGIVPRKTVSNVLLELAPYLDAFFLPFVLYVRKGPFWRGCVPLLSS